MKQLAFRKLIAAALLTLPFALLPAQAPTASPTSDAAYFRGDWAAALPGYVALAKTDSTNAIVWFRLGASHHGLGQYPEAITALQRASRLGFQPLAVKTRLARAYAMNGNRALALTYIDSVGQLAAAGAQPAMLTGATEFASLKSDTRFTSALAKIEAVRYPCKAMPEAHQFDFWIGEWDVRPWGGGGPPNPGYNDIHPILEHCVLSENWVGGGGSGDGKSYNYWDTNLSKWRQVWMSDGGGPLDYTGEFRDGAMRFAGWTLDPAGHRLEQKLTFTPFGRDTVRQTFEQSADAGKTWTVTFDGRYVRRVAKPGK